MNPPAVTAFTETAALYAVMNDDLAEARRIADDMLPGERATLATQLDTLRDILGARCDSCGALTPIGTGVTTNPLSPQRQYLCRDCVGHTPPVIRTITIDSASVELDDGENLRDLAIGDSVDLNPTTGHAGLWIAAAFHGDYRDQITLQSAQRTVACGDDACTFAGTPPPAPRRRPGHPAAPPCRLRSSSLTSRPARLVPGSPAHGGGPGDRTGRPAAGTTHRTRKGSTMGNAYYVIQRDGHKIEAGYSVDAVCERGVCTTEIDRGMDYLCGESPGGTEYGCGGYFCPSHLFGAPDGQIGSLCATCLLQSQLPAELLDAAVAAVNDDEGMPTNTPAVEQLVAVPCGIEGRRMGRGGFLQQTADGADGVLGRPGRQVYVRVPGERYPGRPARRAVDRTGRRGQPLREGGPVGEPTHHRQQRPAVADPNAVQQGKAAQWMAVEERPQLRRQRAEQLVAAHADEVRRRTLGRHPPCQGGHVGVVAEPGERCVRRAEGGHLQVGRGREPGSTPGRGEVPGVR